MNGESGRLPPSLELSEGAAGCAAKDPYALRVLGDSMEPEFPDGCVIIIEPSTCAEAGNYVIAEPEGEGLIFRQLTGCNGSYSLTPVNKNYQSIAIKDLKTIRGIIVQKSIPRSRHRKYYL